MRVLDEVADAIRLARGGYTVRVHSAVVLEEVLGGPISPRQWSAMEEHLGCPLPPLEFDQGHYFRKDEFVTVWDLVEHVGRHRPSWERPMERPVAAWREAQIFAGVRVVLVDCANVDPGEVVRTARLRRDLNME
jgi:hypothetical protein